MFKSVIGIIFITFVLGGCVATSRQETPDVFTYKKFNPPIDKVLEAETGEHIFVEGAFIEGEAIEIDTPLDLMIPGSMFIPFPAHIDRGRLILSRITNGWKYYCGEQGKVAASFPGLGSVISNGDCVGIRISTSDGNKQWVVDNSIHNRGMETIWTTSMSSDDAQKYTPKATREPFRVQSLKRISFDGYYGKQLHFGYTEIDGNFKDKKDFTFDFDGNPTLVSVKGNRFTVLSADNVMMRYSWQTFR